MSEKVIEKGKKFSVIVKPNSSSSMIEIKRGLIEARIKSAPIDGKANKELEKLFFKKFKHHIIIKSGKNSRKKIIEIID